MTQGMKWQNWTLYVAWRRDNIGPRLQQLQEGQRVLEDLSVSQQMRLRNIEILKEQ